MGPKKTQKYQNLENQCQEWINQDTLAKGHGEYVYRIKVMLNRTYSVHTTKSNPIDDNMIL